MRHLGLSMLLVLFAAPALGASEPEPTREVVPRVVEAPAVTAPEQSVEMELEEVVIRESVASEDAAAAQLGPRGSFWWVVGVVVVAGVILAVLL